MHQKVRAIYRAGAFVLQEPWSFPEGAEVELIVQGPLILSPEVTDPDDRAHLLRIITERMQHNPIPGEAPHLTREELHARG